MKRGAYFLAGVCLLFVWGCPGAVFYSERDGRAQIYKTDDSGIIQGNISNNPYPDRYPDVSPDATQVVFSSERAATGISGIYTMSRDGGNATELVSGPGRRIMPRWGQNGLIAFAYSASGQNVHVRTVKSNGTEERQLTSPGTTASDDGGHDFFYAGEMIVFARRDLATQKHDLFVMKIDGTGTPQNITSSPAIDETFPAVSHDGRLLACRIVLPGQAQEMIRLYNVGAWTIIGDITLPSPAGAVITGLGFTQEDDRLYVSAEVTDVASPDPGRRQEIIVVKTDGTGFGRLTTNAALDAWPAAIAKKNQSLLRIPVLFVHGHSGGKDAAWENPGSAGTTSLKAALTANPSLPIQPVYLSLPLHGSNMPENFGRSIADDATDILAAIEGGNDSKGQPQMGILNDPAYGGAARVALVGYSQGAISSRYYLKNLMGSRKGGTMTVSEFVALAAPTHGVGGSFSCGTESEPDRSTRQLCGGRTANVLSQLQPCGKCAPVPPLFSTNAAGDDTFLTDINGHPFSANCSETVIGNPGAEAPKSRPTVPGGVLYVNLYAAGNTDPVVGGQTQSEDCFGRRLARNHSPDAFNMEISGVPPDAPLTIHGNFPHHWPTLCVVLKTLVNHSAPANQTDACQGLTRPQ